MDSVFRMKLDAVEDFRLDSVMPTEIGLASGPSLLRVAVLLALETERLNSIDV